MNIFIEKYNRLLKRSFLFLELGFCFLFFVSMNPVNSQVNRYV